MYRLRNFIKNSRAFGGRRFSDKVSLPASADVVIIGGGNVGCQTLYQLSKRGVNAVLLERHKLTSGTTWHTAGCIWALRPTAVEISLLELTRNSFQEVYKETGLDPGFIKNGGIFISHSEERTNEYKRLHTIGHLYGIESHILSPEETIKLYPLLDPTNFTAALYSPADGSIDPSMLVSAVTKAATNLGAQIFEDCPVTQLNIETQSDKRKITGVITPYGTIQTKCVVNCTGVWAKQIAKLADVELPLVPMKHAYVIFDSIPGVKGVPNVRDHDGSFYFRIQGESICLGGYENNPIILKENVPDDFHFGLYDLDFSTFDIHMKNAIGLCPPLERAGMKTTMCGPESFTPDHKPILGEDPRLIGLFQGCGFNSLGMSLGGGCGHQLAEWITKGRPSLHMYTYDVRRFTPELRGNQRFSVEQSHESYVKNYSIVFPHDERLSGRNIKKDVFFEDMVEKGAVMEQRSGWERPGYYLKDGIAPVAPYDWYGQYGHELNKDERYRNALKDDYTFGFGKIHDLIGEEAMACRTRAALFNLSYFTKMYLTGPEAQEAADWLFTANTRREPERVVYTCALNSQGGVEADVTVTALTQGVGALVGPILKGRGYYIVAGGATGYQTISHLKRIIHEKGFKCCITDVTDKMGVLSLQGPKSGEIVQSITESPITDEHFPVHMSRLITIDGHQCRAMRVSFVGELGYELHIPTASCKAIYEKVQDIGRSFGMRNAGFRALYSLSCEKGYPLWGEDLWIEDNPIEANLGYLCRKDGHYLGKDVVDKAREGVIKRRVFITLDDKVPVWGLETIWRDDTIIGYLRRGEYAYYLDKSIGIGYVKHPKNKPLTNDFLLKGNYEVEIMGKKYGATLHLSSPFDPKHQRQMGDYEQHVNELSHFED